MVVGTSVVTGLHDHHCIWSVMQKSKNILGSRKKGAQEPHAAREQRYDYQGNAPSNLKGISLESLTLPAGLTSYCTVPQFLPARISIWPFPACATVCVLCFVSPCRELGADAGWVQEYGRRGHWHGLPGQPLAASAHWWAGICLVMHHMPPGFQARKRSSALRRCGFSLDRTRTSRAGRTRCRTSRAPLWNLALYSSSSHTWSRSKRKPFRGKKEESPHGRRGLSCRKGKELSLWRHVCHVWLTTCRYQWNVLTFFCFSRFCDMFYLGELPLPLSQNRRQRWRHPAQRGGRAHRDPEIFPVRLLQPLADDQDLPCPRRLFHHLRRVLRLKSSAPWRGRSIWEKVDWDDKSPKAKLKDPSLYSSDCLYGGSGDSEDFSVQATDCWP